MQFDPSLSQAVWRDLVSQALEAYEKRLDRIEARQETMEEECKSYLVEEDIRLLKVVVFGYIGLILTTVSVGMIGAGVYFAAMAGGAP